MPKIRARVHKGISATLRARLKTQAGVQLDEESAQLALNGFPVTMDPGISEAITGQVLNLSDPRIAHKQREDWELAHPTRNPYPPVFAQKVLDQTRAIALLINQAADSERVLTQLDELAQLCHHEMSDDE